jgi:ATP-dependent HslUV protease ATP-binding subunit HslU
MKTEGLHLEFTTAALHRIAEISWQVNEKTENIGARRLHTVLERLLEELSFDATDVATKEGGKFVIDETYVNDHLENLAGDADLSRFIL